MRDCPNCKTMVDGVLCPKCGYREDGRTGDYDPHRHLCSHMEYGQRCASAGSLTTNTYPDVKAGQAHPGPWFCHVHFPPFRHWNQGERTAPGSGFEAIKNTLRRADPEAIAERAAIQDEACPNTGA